MTQNKWDEDVTTSALLALGALNRNHALFLIVLIAVWDGLTLSKFMIAHSMVYNGHLKF